MKYWMRAAAGAVVVAASIAVAPLSATAGVPRDPAAPTAQDEVGTQANWLHIANFGSEKCLAVPGGSTLPRVGLIQWSCGTWLDHYWEFRPSYGGRYYIVNRNSGYCVALPNGTHDAGAQVIQWPCGDWPDHHWWLVHQGGPYYKIVNNSSGQCLAIRGGSDDDGAAAIQWPCGDWDDHFWYFFTTG